MPIINMVYKKKKWWKPWANTIAYYPLTTDVNDYSWNGNNMTNNWIVFWTYNGVKCAYLNNSSYATKSWSLFTWNPTFTVSIWFNNIARNDGETPRAFGSSEGTNSFILWISNTRILYTWWWSNDRNTGYTITANTWYNVVFAYSWWSGTVYVNWASVYSWTRSPTIWNTSTLIWDNHTLTAKWYWYLSDAIFENKKWSADEVSKYYESTKSIYGY